MPSHMNDQSNTIMKRFRKHVKELTSACYELIAHRHGTTPNKSKPAVIQAKCLPMSTGEFLSSIGPCHSNFEQIQPTIDQSNLSRQISNISLTLNPTPYKKKSVEFKSRSARLRIGQNYQRRFIGDVSVLESEIVTLVNSNEHNWMYVRRGDGRQGFIPKQILQLN